MVKNQLEDVLLGIGQSGIAKSNVGESSSAFGVNTSSPGLELAHVYVDKGMVCLDTIFPGTACCSTSVLLLFEWVDVSIREVDMVGWSVGCRFGLAIYLTST
jgi:hypothetical protein